jgi:NAD(P)-dependent dehydrogenase (short-subunit alcohol dehydrogenase family)
MEKRLEGKIPIVTGAGRTPGGTFGNGRAISVLFARAGAKLMLVDVNLQSAQDTQSVISQEGGEAFPFSGDVPRGEDCRGIAEKAVETYGRIDFLVNNVGIGLWVGQGPIDLSEEAWERILNITLKSMFLTCKYALPVTEEQGSGAIVNISSTAAASSSPLVAYKTSKAGVNAFTHSIAMKYAPRGIRVNGIMLGLMNTPMAIEGISKASGITKKDLIRERSGRVPLKGGDGFRLRYGLCSSIPSIGGSEIHYGSHPPRRRWPVRQGGRMKNPRICRDCSNPEIF